MLTYFLFEVMTHSTQIYTQASFFVCVLYKLLIYLSLDKYASPFGAGSSYAYFHDEDESTFHLVDSTREQKPPYQRGRARGQRSRGARGARTPGGMTTLNKVIRNHTTKIYQSKS